MKTVYTEDFRRDVVAAYANGASLKRIRGDYLIDSRQLYRWLDRAGVSVRKPMRKKFRWTPGLIEQVRRLHALGTSDKKIAKALRCGATTVRGCRTRLGLPALFGWPPPRAAAAAAAALALLLVGSQALAHSFYTELQRNDGGGSCCSSTDCRPVEPCLTPNRRAGFMADGVCEQIPTDKVLPVASPDGELHACYQTHWLMGGQPTHQILCIIQAGQS